VTTCGHDWRADHAKSGVANGWTSNRSHSGIVVNGDDVTAYGLFSEHQQQFQTLWNGNGGAVYFYQSEMPYDPPDQAAWMESASEDGYASYKVASTVASHTRRGDRRLQLLRQPGPRGEHHRDPVRRGNRDAPHDDVHLGDGGIDDIINGTGGAATAYSSY
jgi:hypothetical protein